MHSTAVIVSALLVASLGIAGCGGTADSSRESRDEADANASAGAAEGGSGTLRLGDQTYEFTVGRCNLEGETDPERESTLYGRGTTTEGESFRVQVSRMQPGNTLIHVVSLNYGDFQAGTGTAWEAERHQGNDGSWTVMDGTFEQTDDPLIRIDGQSVTAEGNFRKMNSGESRAGVLHATCS